MSTTHMQVLNTAIAKRLTQPQIECGWHKKYFDETLVMKEGAPNNVSHSICPACYSVTDPEITPEHEALRASVLQSRLAAKAPVERLAKPQEKAALYSTQTNRRGGTTQTVTARKETPWSYNGIDIV